MKKIFLFTIIVGFLLLNLSPLLAQAEEHDHYRTIGKGVASWCDHNEGESWTCTCQNSNVVQCQVGNIISDPICACCGDCTLNNFLGIGINLANLIFKYLGVVALLFFVIGGVIWVTSGGSQERIK